MIILLIGTIISQNGDTLFFVENNEMRDTIIVAESAIDPNTNQKVVKKVKISNAGDMYFVYEERCKLGNDSVLGTKITFYDVHQRKMLEQKAEDDRKISFELSDIRDSMLFITTWDHQYRKPAFCVVKGEKKFEIVKEGDWERIVNYQVSSNNRYILFHMRNPYNDKPWDYIYFHDLTTGRNWDYLFPSCLSCKKSRIYLEVDNNGRAEVIHKNEHRVFSPEGILEDIYLKPQ